ncbi:hypothetical protein CHUAL_012945 [Chamberlinius hualienensis]
MLAKTSRTVAFCSVANFINAADRIIMPIAVIPIGDQYHWSLHLQGWVLSSFSFGYFTSQILGADAARKFGGKRVLACAVFLWSLSTLLTPFVASSAYLVIATRIVLGLGEGIGLPTIFHLFAHTIPVEERSRSFGYLIAFGTFGQTIAAIVCPLLPWNWMFYLFGSLGLVWVFLWVLLYRDTSRSEDELPVVFPKYSVPQVTTRSWWEFVVHWPLWAIYIAHFTMNWSSYMLMNWLPTYLARNLGANKEDISLTAVPYFVNSLVGMVSGHLADSFISRKWSILSVRRLMTCIGLIGPGVFLLCFCNVKSMLFAVIFVSLSMGMSACNSAGHLTNHADVAPNHAGISFAVSNTIATIPGILCGPLTAELVTQSHGRWFPVFVLAAGFNFVGAVIYYSHSSASQIL